MSKVSGIQGQLLEVTVVGCSKLKDTEWISRQDPYVCLEYASTKFRTRTCTDGGKNPVFQEKTIIPLIEGLREITVTVWNSNTITTDDFIGSGKIQLQKVLSQGFDDSSWPLQTKSGRFAGEVKVITHFPNVQKPQKAGSEYAQTAPPHMHAAPPHGGHPYPQVGAYPATAPYPAMQYPPASYPHADHAMHPSSTYPPPPVMQQPYPPAPYPHTAYPPQSYPPPPHGQPYGYPPPPGHYPGAYPPPPYY